jgi:hypothetical protein
MPSSGMLRRVGLVRTEVLDDLITSMNRVTRIGEPGTTLAVTRTEARCEDILCQESGGGLITWQPSR